MGLLSPLREYLLIGSTMVMMMVMMVTQNVNAKPQDPSVFEDIASKGLVMAGNMAEMVGNAGMISKQMGFEVPFGKADSGTQIGTGAAFRNDDDSSEEDRRRRKRHSQDLKLNYYGDILGEESLLALPHLHRGKRSPCHHGGTGGGTGTGGTDDNIAVDGDDIDLAERRRRAYARRRKAAARKKATNGKKTTSKTNNRRRNKSLVNDDVEQTLTRRKRQSEVDDLNQNMTAVSKDFSQQAQQIADKIRSVVANLMNSMNDMAQKLKQHLTGQNSTTTEEI